MGESFYTSLGVDPDAEAATIRRAYRKQVKKCHPDVSDAPDASKRFKRLTTARDVLLDTDERARYDRLGHNSYVRQHVETSVWQPDPTAGQVNQSDSSHSTSTPDAGSPTQSGTEEHTWRDSTQTTGFDQSAGRTHNWSRTTGRSRADRSTRSEETGGATADGASGARHADHTWRDARQRSWSRPDGGNSDDGWQRAPDAYMRSETTVEFSVAQQILDAIQQVGIWLFVHLVLFMSAIATSWFLLSWVGTDPVITAATGLFSLLLVGLVVMLSTLQIVTELS